MERSEESSPMLFHCPTCGAALPVPDAPSVRCSYCGSTVLVPPEYRERKEAAESVEATTIVVGLSDEEIASIGKKTKPALGIMLTVWILVVVCIVVSTILAVTGAFTGTALFASSALPTRAAAVMPTIEVSLPTALPPTPTPIPPVRVEVLFGGEGSGPGQFDDARHVAVDGDGNLFVANYQDGRIQKFDPQGKFLQLINVEPDRNGYTIIRDLAGDYRGNLYVARGGDLLIYSMADGSLVGSIPGSFPDLNHDQVTTDPANNVYAVSTANGNSIVKYSPQAEVIWVKEQILEGIAPKNKPSDVSDMIVDGLGNIFILNRGGYEIYKFDAQGNFVDRFGSRGEELMQFNNPATIAVDGKGRVFVLDSARGYVLKIFDNRGTFLKVLPWPDDITFPRTMLFDAKGDLYTVTNTNQVARMTISEALDD